MQTSLSSAVLAVLVFAFPGTQDVAAQAQARAPDLLRPLEGARDPYLGILSKIRRARPVTIDLARLRTLDPRKAEVLRVELFPDTVFRARFEQREDHGPGRFEWHGSLQAYPGSRFLITVVDDAVAATFLPNDGRRWTLAIQGAPGMHVVRELDGSGSRCGTDGRLVVPPPIRRQRQGGLGPLGNCSDNPDQISVLVVYDKSAVSQAGSFAKIVAAIQHGITISNGINKRSKMAMRFSLARARAVNYSSTSSMLTELKRLSSTTDKIMDEVHAWRVTNKADLVAFVVGDHKNHGNILGIAWKPSSSSQLHPGTGFSVTEWNSINSFTLTHEMGHNFGCDHDEGNKGSRQIYPYAFGHKWGLWPSKGVTVMSYRAAFQTRYGFWSTPLVKFAVWPVGSAKHDNRRVILNTRAKVANYSRILDGTNRAPFITSHPRSTSVCQGYQARIMSVSASAATAYQWRHNGKVISGQKGSALTLTNVTAASAGRYDCIISNSCASTTTRFATLSVRGTCRKRYFRGVRPSSGFGVSVSRLGDFNRDGYEDFAIGAPSSGIKGKNSGEMKVYSGKDSAVLFTSSFVAGEKLGESVAAAGDVDQDGYADVIVGAPMARLRGSARVFSGRTRRLIYTFYGDRSGDSFGIAVSGAGDVDGDGYADLVVGAPDSDRKGKDSGMVRVYSGRTGKPILVISFAAGERLGQAVAAAGDVNQDGYADFLVGAPGSGKGMGSARLISGRTGWVLHTILGKKATRDLGRSVTGLGDLNLDGYPDYAVGAPRSWMGPNRIGLVQVFSGKDRKLLFTFRGNKSDDYFGWSIAKADDFDRDGRPDIHVGAPGGSNSPGYVITYSGRTGYPIHRRYGISGRGQFGYSVSGLMADGDAGSDFLVGAPSFNSAWLFDAPLATNPPKVELYGKACPSSRNTLPHMAIGGRPSIGLTFTPTLYAGSATAPALLQIALARRRIDLGPIGAPGCTAYVLPIFSLATATNSAGRVSFPLLVPRDSTLIGVVLQAQWLTFDKPANRLGIVASTAARIRLGRQ